ncbi:MAG: RiPP maturation radical SAM C-methyltransferase [Candidatus Aminicenantes bacterium]|nr:MAG: RiPP maturation radical SAM C-methyltransferase [Candidatus Aminicenantes bacterium]
MKHMEKQVFDLFFEAIPNGGEVLLLVSPLFWTRVPLLSLHLLQAACGRAGITTHVLYSNLLYSIITSPGLHTRIVLEGEEYLLLGDRLFSAVAFGHSAVEGCMDKFLDPTWFPDHTLKINPGMVKQVPQWWAPFREWIGTVDWKHLESLTTHWVQMIARRIASMGYRVVGCSTTHSGLVPAVALLDNIKKENSNVITIIGGTLCEEEMAEGILSLKSDIDYVFSGEGELTFPDLVKQVLAGNLPGEKIIYGQPVMNLDTLPFPDYQDYFAQLETLPHSNRPPPGSIELPYETSRGCWYGKCTFCSMTGKTNLYRKKSPDKIPDDLKQLIDRYDIHTLFMTDNIIPPQYFTTLLPRISKEISSISFRYELRANLTLERVLSLKRAGAIRIDPGIESLSPSLLGRMRKGVTVRENIALLRYARSAQLDISWNLLFGFPGDKSLEYEEMLQLLPLIRHLPPPYVMLPLVICRFSPYQAFPEAFGISNIRPAEFYKDILPFHAQLGKIAYYFTGDFETQSYEHPEIIIALGKEFQAWKRAWAVYEMVPLEIFLPTLHITRNTENEYVLVDSRGIARRPGRMILDRQQASILLVPRPLNPSADFQWAVDAQLGVVMDSWFIPLATAEPGLILEFERDYESGN